MSIEVSTVTTRLCCVTGYEPQQSDCVNHKEKSWNFLEKEVHSAKHGNVGIIVEIDSNAWAGDKLIPNDPHTQKFLNKKEKNMTLVKSLPLCEAL